MEPKIKEIQKRLKYLKKELLAERISYGELAELQTLADYISPDDTVFLEAAGVAEKDPDTFEQLEDRSKEIEEMENKTIEILLHNIEYWYEEKEEMEITESDIEHVKKMIDDGCYQGELCTIPDGEDEEVYGWWKIIKE